MIIPEINADHAEIIQRHSASAWAQSAALSPLKSNCSIQSYVPALFTL